MLDDVFYVLGPDGSIERVNERAVEVTGYSRETLTGMDPTELFLPDDRSRVQANIEETLKTGHARLEASVLTEDGREIPYEFRKRRLMDGSDAAVGVVGIGRDISDRKHRERQLQRQLEQLEHFGSVLSHDLQTPLATARGRLDLARETGDSEHFDKAERALRRLETLIDDLAAVMREGELVSESTVVDVGQCVRDLWASLDEGDATLRVDGPIRIRADEHAVARLLENLLNNAVEHGGDGVTVPVGSLSDGFYVEDDGPGISDEIRENVFELGFTAKSDREGTGFGLASAGQIAVAHGWEIRVTESSDGGRSIRDN